MNKKEILSKQEHRPFPLPKIPWAMQQTWKDLLFLHYKAPIDTLRRHVPDELEIDLFEGGCWVGLTPFKMRDVRFRFLPPIPTASNFLELNFRTYVKMNGRPGIFFFSLDASSGLSALGARLGAYLPYFAADMTVEEKDGWFRFKSARRSDPSAAFDVKYKPEPPVFEAAPGSLEGWFVERYCLFQETAKGKYIEIDIHHLKWLLQTAEVKIARNWVPKAHGIDLPGEKPLAHFAAVQEVLVWPPKVVVPRQGLPGN